MTEAEHLERLRADLDAVTTLQLSGFADAAWLPLADALVEYGFAVMRVWIANGRIFTEMARMHMPLPVPRKGWLTLDEAESMAGEVVTLALTAFKNDVLAKGCWNPGKGASLTTFFVGQCKLQFSNVYRNWLRSEERYRMTGTHDPEGVLLHGGRPLDPGAEAVDGLMLKEMLGRMKPLTAEVVYRKAVLGMSYEQIAGEVAGIKNAKAAENLMTREKVKWQKARRAS
jgi:hypothetical protein